MSNTFSLNDIGRRYHATNVGSNNVVSIDNNDVTNLAGALTIKEGTQNNRIITSIDSSSPAKEQLVISHNGNVVEIDNVNTNANSVIKFLSDVTFTKPVYITESGLGTSASGHGGTIVLQHQTSGGRNSITFRSAINAGHDHGAIEYVDGENGNERGILRLIAENDGDGQFEDQVRVRIAGSDIVRFASNGVSIDTSSDPSYTLDVGGDGRFSDELLVMDAKIGTVNNHAAFAYDTYFNGTNYALLQTSNGDTVINAISGKKIFFKNANVTSLCVSEHGLYTDDTTTMILNKSGTYLQLGTNLDAINSYNYNTAKFTEGKDAYITSGNAFLGFCGHNGLAGFGHRTKRSASDYAILQDGNGHTYVNCASGSTLNLRNGNSANSQATIYDGNLHFNKSDFLIKNESGQGANNAYKIFTIKGWVNHNDTAASGSGSTTGTRAECLRMTLYNSNISYFAMATKGYIWMVHSSNSNVSMQLYCYNLTFNTTTGASDDRLKHNEKPINNALSTIRKLKPQVYDKASELNDTINTVREAGLIAQEVYEIPELKDFVKLPETDPDHPAPYKYWGLNYGSLFTYNIAATKELDSVVQTQQTEINELKE